MLDYFYFFSLSLVPLIPIQSAFLNALSMQFMLKGFFFPSTGVWIHTKSESAKLPTFMIFLFFGDDWIKKNKKYSMLIDIISSAIFNRYIVLHLSILTTYAFTLENSFIAFFKTYDQHMLCFILYISTCLALPLYLLQFIGVTDLSLYPEGGLETTW